METKSFISLEVLAAKTRLPQGYLKELSEARKIPCLSVRGRRRFNFQKVMEALNQLAEQEADDA